MDDEGWVIVVPISFGAVVLTLVMTLATGMSIIYSIKSWLTENLPVVLSIVVVVAILNVVLSSILSKSIIYGISSLISITQLAFFVIYGGMNLPAEGHGFVLIWECIVFILYVLYGVINIIAVFGIDYFVIAESISDSKFHKSKRYALGLKDSIPNYVVCAIGWIINAIIFLVL